jgi:tetratricopeptide (TPR) repeat protein
VIYDRTQQPGKAAAQFEKAVTLAPENPQAWDYLALTLEPLGEFARAEQAYQKGLAVNRGPLFDAFLDYNYGRFLMKMNRLEEAAVHLDRAVALAPQTRAVYYERAKLQEKRGRLQEARRDAEKAASLPDPAGVILDLQVYYQLARIYSRLGEKELAAKYRKLAETSKVPISSRMRGGR